PNSDAAPQSSRITTPASRRKTTVEIVYGQTLARVENGEIDGVILVGAFGYHSIGPLGTQGQPLTNKLKSEGREDRFLDEYVELKRDEELEVLKYIAPQLKARTKKKLWLLSVITKEDLWFDAYDLGWQHYSAGEYNDTIEGIRNAIGTRSFRHELVTMSLLIKDFVTGRNELLASSSQQYDQGKQAESANRFFAMISSLS
ncbi:MAG: hypothetical protein IIA14_13685, partial [SAR324 cluster bacterium]|nr:hypothetical protein [SAR324 cluster bacterium]